MLRKKAFHFRVFPNQEQAVLISKTLGCSRFVFKRFLARWNETYKQTGKGLDSTVLQTSLQNLTDTFTRFFKKQMEAPRFKSKKNKVQTYTTKHMNANIRIDGNQITLLKLGWQ